MIASVLFCFTFQRKITGFFCIGDVFPASPYIDKSSAYVFTGKVGYDGQFFLAIALDPALHHEKTIKALDNPKFRYRRIGYPLVGYIAGLGNPGLIPYTLVGTNILCIAVLVLLTSALFQMEGMSNQRKRLPLWVLAIPGVWVTLCVSTADLLGTTLFVAALVGLRLRHIGLASIALGLACLTRETYLAVAVILVAFELGRNSKKALWLGLAAVPALLWNGFVYVCIKEYSSGIRENFGVPFAGILAKFQLALGSGLTIKNLYETYSFAIVIMAAAFAAVSVIRNWKKPDEISLCALPYLAILVVGKMQIFGYHANYFRVFMDIFIVNLLTAENSLTAAFAKKSTLLLGAFASAAYIVHYVTQWNP